MERHPLLSASILLIVAGCNGADSVSSVNETIIASDLTCASCSIAVRPVAQIDGSSYLGQSGRIAHDAAGRLYIAEGRDVFVYNADGNRVKQVGKRGAGPGEFERIRNVLVDESGQIHVLDGQLARHTIFDAEGSYVGSATSAAIAGNQGWDAALLAGNRLVVNRPPSVSGTKASLIQIIDRQGTLLNSLEEVPISSVDHSWLYRRELTVRRSGELVVADPYSFTLNLYDSTLSTMRAFRREADWIPKTRPTDIPSDGVFDRPFTPYIEGMWEDSNGLIWLHSMT